MRRLMALLLWAMLAATPAQAVECIRGPYIQNAGIGTITIRWELDRLGASSVQYTTGAEKPRTIKCEFEGRKHRVTLTKLTPGEIYRYSIWFGTERVTQEFSFRATPKAANDDGDPPRFTFAVFGDFGAGTTGQKEVARLLEKSKAEFAILTGDLIYGRGEEEHYDLRFFQPYGRSIRRMTFWPALGNHDVGAKDGAGALAAFDVPLNGPRKLQGGRNYSFDYGNAHFAAIDSNAHPDVMKKSIGPWLVEDMRKSGKPWRFVFFHHPPFSSAAHGENAKMRDIMVPFFERADIDIAFGGHDHSYERTKPRDGVTYVVSGNAGQTLYGHAHPHDYTEVFYNEKHGLTFVTIEGPRLELRHIDVDGVEVDYLDLRQ